jgi:phosphoribosylformylglycinamidine cyclo-ligase
VDFPTDPGDKCRRMSPLSRDSAYRSTGVDTEGAESAIRELAKWIDRTFEPNPHKPALPLGYYANVIPLTADLALAISTDGVGTKILVAEDMDKYDTVGIDCVAMNANDIVCVGAAPVTLVDYVAVEKTDAKFLGEIGKGLYEGAKQAGISIPGGELAQVREMVRGTRPGRGFDLVGTCVGTLRPDRIVVGEHVEPGDALVGIASSGVHSNGFTLARHVLFEKAHLSVRERPADLGRSLGEELLEPTLIYVREAVEMLAKLRVKAMAHITGDGLLNLPRIKNRTIGFVIDQPLSVPPIFAMIQRLGAITDAEMFSVFNMGMGFCVVVAPKDAPRAIEMATAQGKRAQVVGYAVADPERRVWIPRRRLVATGSSFRTTSEYAPDNPRG